MFFSRYGCIVGAVAAFGAVSLWVSSAQSIESDPVDQGVPGQPQPNTDIVQPSDAHPPKSPLRLSTIDYQDAGDKPGKLTVAGVALPGRELFLFLDDQPFTNTVPDDSGNWSVESEVKLSDGRHTFRADQFDKDTNMLAARAMITFEQAKQPAQDAAPAEPPKAATP
jgi:nucleoid-associated protein YgaU